MIAEVRPRLQRHSGRPPLSRHLWGIVIAGSEPVDDATVVRLARRRPRLHRSATRPTRLRQTIDRASRLIPPRRLIAVLAREDAARYEAALSDVPDIERVVQPVYRGTAAEIFLPLLRIVQQDPHAIVVVLPGDELIDYGARFMSYVAKGVAAVSVRRDLPLVIGARPLAPDPSSTWIEPGPPVDGLESLAIRTVKRVLHRPSLAEVETLYEGDGLLSTLVLIATARRLLELGQRYLPEVLETLEPLETAAGGAEERLLCEALYEGMPHASISRDVLERADDFAVLPVPDVMWGDLARPAALTALAS
jgi:mannose-1-phosphate guanylyltransferase